MKLCAWIQHDSVKYLSKFGKTEIESKSNEEKDIEFLKNTEI